MSAASALARAAGLELAARGTRCNVVEPGSTDTRRDRTERRASLFVPPMMLRALLADPRSRERVAQGQVRYAVTSGEALTADLVAGSVRWLGVPPTNLYRPTEAAIDVTCWGLLPH
ncbi:MAG: hypothetical protein QM655_01980 [Nocardioidaceae bacterium]